MAARKRRKTSVKSLKALLSGKNRTLDKIIGDSHFRFLMTTALGGGWNMIYALYHLVLAAVFRSFWFLTLGVYYLTICGMRASALTMQNHIADSPSQRRALRRNALLTFALALIFAGVVCLTIVEKRNKVYNTIVAITMAIYSFYCVVSAIMNLIRLKDNRTEQKIMLRNCSMVYALGSLFGLESMMLGTFGSAADHFTTVMEAASGTGIFIIIALFGVNLMMMSSKKQT